MRDALGRNPTSRFRLSLAELRELVAALRPRIEGGQLQRITEADEHRLYLTIRGREAGPGDGEREAALPGPGRTWELLACTHPRLLGFFLTSHPNKERPKRPLAFDERLRATVLNARVRGVRLPWDDRVVVLDLAGGAGAREGAPMVAHQLLVELSGHHANIFLLTGEGTILASLKPSASRRRDLRPGQPYTPPPSGPCPQPAAAENELLGLRGTGEEIHRAAAARFEAAFLRHHYESEINDLSRAVRAAVRRAHRLQAGIEADRERALDAELWRRRGEVLKTILHRASRGLESIRAVDYGVMPPEEIDIPLDPRLDARANLAAIFGRYRKMVRAQAECARRLAEVAPRQAALARLEERVAAHVSKRPPWPGLDDPVDESRRLKLARHALDALAAEAAKLEVSARPRGKGARRARHRTAARVPYRRYTAVDGSEILVGRKGADNGTLTFRVARDNDLWLHVRGGAGSHVIVRKTKGRPIVREVLLDAASLAMHFSKAREDTRAEVHLTSKRLVRPLTGAPPGTVRVERSETIQVTRDPERLGRLLATRT